MRLQVGVVYDWLRIIDNDVDDIASYLRFADYDGDDIVIHPIERLHRIPHILSNSFAWHLK